MGTTIDRATEDEWVRRIAQGEGFSATQTPDPSGNGVCVGYGHNLNTSGRGAKWVKSMTGKDINNGDRLTRADADKICRADLQTTYAALDQRFPWWKDLDPASQYVMVDMCYTMGAANLAKFKNMLGALREGDYEKASNEIVRSKYYNDTTRRAARNAELLRTGEWRELDCVLKNKHTIKDSKGRYVVKDSHTGQPYDYDEHPTRIKGKDITKNQVKEDTENAHKYSAQVEQQTQQQVAHAKVAQGRPAARAAEEPTKPKASASMTMASTAATNTPKTRAVAKANTGNVTENDKKQMRNMLGRLNKRNGKSRAIDVEATINALTERYGENASKMLSKIMMSPSTVAAKEGLVDKNGKPLGRTRLVLQQICKEQEEKQKNNTTQKGKEEEKKSQVANAGTVQKRKMLASRSY